MTDKFTETTPLDPAATQPIPGADQSAAAPDDSSPERPPSTDPQASDVTVALSLQGDTVAWHDPKRYLWALGLIVPLQTFVAAGLVAMTGQGIFWWWGVIFTFGLVPLMDVVVGNDTSNPPDSQVAAIESDRWYRWLTYAYLPLQYLSLVFACWLWTTADLSALDRLGLAATVGIVGGIAINAAHELGHKRDDVERWLSKIALAQSGYGHFYVEHNRGHHVRVATPDDPASSRLGESFWRFWPRTVTGSAQSAWAMESRRFSRRGTTRWTWRNDVLNAWAMTVFLWLVLVAAFGPAVLVLLVLQAVVAFTLLELVNYIEHYGLLRAPRGDKFVKVTARDSWNANNTASNLLLYHLQRHSDHHANPARRYQALRHFDDAPQLPSGYAAMVLLALIPPLWFKVMDQRVVDHYEGNVLLANIDPRNHDAIVKRYGRGTTWAGSRAAGGSPIPPK